MRWTLGQVAVAGMALAATACGGDGGFSEEDRAVLNAIAEQKAAGFSEIDREKLQEALTSLSSLKESVDKLDPVKTGVVKPPEDPPPDVPPPAEVYEGQQVYALSSDLNGTPNNTSDDKAWITIVDPTKNDLIRKIPIDGGADWGDVLASPDGARLFINERRRNQVIVLNTLTHAIKAELDVGGRPTHMYNPNHGNEIWTHSDEEGAFYVIDVDTLEVSGPIVAALENQGHGKLVYDPELAPKAYATNTNDAAVFPVNLDTKSVGYAIPVCGYTDMNGQPAGGTHDKAMSPYNGYAYFQCTGGQGYSIVDSATNQVLADKLPILGRVAVSPDHRFVLVMNDCGDGSCTREEIKIWDTMLGNGMTIDHTLTLDGRPSANGTQFHLPGNNYNALRAYIPLSSGEHVAVLDFAKLVANPMAPQAALTTARVGSVTDPGTSHWSRRGVLSHDYFHTVADGPNGETLVAIKLSDHSLSENQMPIDGVLSRLAFVDTTAVSTAER